MMTAPRIACLLPFCLALTAITVAWAAEPAKYARYEIGGRTAYGVVEGENVRRIEGDLFGKWEPTDDVHPLASVKLLVPTEPKQVFALAGNYKSHINDGTTTTIVTITNIIKTDPAKDVTTTETRVNQEVRRSGEVPERFQISQPFFKSIGSLAAQGEPIVIPKDATNVHYEAELVVVIGKTARNVSKQQAMDFVFGVTCGNDVSARDWQRGDVQWWRAKGSDTFGPCGPYIVTGLDYDDLLVELRLNGEVKQHERTSEMIQDVATMVSFMSQYVTLYPGDLIFTGTSGRTSEMKPGDVVEVEIEGVGVLTNPVVAGK